MAWQQLTLRLDASDLTATEALLRLAGASSIAVSDGGEAPILEPAPGTTPLWPTLTLTALFDDSADLSAIGAILGRAGGDALSVRPITDEELERAMRQDVRPIDIGPRLAIVPAESFDPADGRSLGLHMGLAFGTGRHPTTRLCLEWLERGPGGAERVLDYGAGTGVLALAALKLGAARALAIDSEPQALEAARQNAELNGLETSIRIGLPETLDAGPFDLVLANILAQPLIELAATFAGLQRPGGTVVLSGILAAQLDAVAAHYERWYEHLERRDLEGWALLTGTRRSGYDR